MRERESETTKHLEKRSQAAFNREKADGDTTQDQPPSQHSPKADEAGCVCVWTSLNCVDAEKRPSKQGVSPANKTKNVPRTHVRRECSPVEDPPPPARCKKKYTHSQISAGANSNAERERTRTLRLRRARSKPRKPPAGWRVSQPKDNSGCELLL